jgi:hypothetical protein
MRLFLWFVTIVVFLLSLGAIYIGLCGLGADGRDGGLYVGVGLSIVAVTLFIYLIR